MIEISYGQLWARDEMQTMLEERFHVSYHEYHKTITHVEELMKWLAEDLKIDDCERVSVI
jgi:hypothetical protein